MDLHEFVHMRLLVTGRKPFYQQLISLQILSFFYEGVTFPKIYFGTDTFYLTHWRCGRILFQSEMNMQAHTGETLSKCTDGLCNNILK